MKIHFGTDKLPKFKNAVVTTGTFDGVHAGHKELLQSIKKSAKQIHGESVIITFHPHPRLIVHPKDDSLRVLTSLNEKIDLLEKEGMDHLVIISFDKEFSQIEANDYVNNFLIQYFNPSVIVLGYNHQFGRHRDGNLILLQKLAEKNNFKVEEIPRQLVDDIDVSSTKIRIAIQEGDLNRANHLLGHPYSLRGNVKRGKQLGRQIGFPTANIRVDDDFKLIPHTGIYAVKATVLNREYNGMMNVGYNPTFNETELSLEVHLFQFDKEIYAEDISINFIARTRDEIKFANLDELVNAIKQDEIIIRKILNC